MSHLLCNFALKSLPGNKIRSSQEALPGRAAPLSQGFGVMTWSEQKNTDTEEVHSLRQRYLNADVSLIGCQKQISQFKRDYNIC